MRDTVIAAAGALLVAVLNELRANARAREADRDRRAREAQLHDRRGDRRTCAGASYSPAERSAGGCDCDLQLWEGGP